jgi:hypothetical protein
MTQRKKKLGKKLDSASSRKAKTYDRNTERGPELIYEINTVF